MAARAFHIDSEKDLRNVLGELHVNGLPCAYVSPPFDPVDETGRILARVDQLPGHVVVGLVLPQGRIEPGRDLFASAGDESGARVVVTQKIVPESQPMIGVRDVIGKKSVDQFLSLVHRLAGRKFLQLFRGGKKTDHVHVRSSDKCGILRVLGSGLFVFGQVVVQQAVDRMIPVLESLG